MEQTSNIRDFTSVSITARWLIKLKGYTSIPYARQVAELLEYPNKYSPDFKNKDLPFWAVTFHLESRYRSVDQLLEDLATKNILELSSGYSFRGLDHIMHDDLFYIDTDLPAVISLKNAIIKSLIKDGSNPKGKLELLPLNVLDKNSFCEITDRFPEGEIIIVNEGLLTYLEREEKEQLCSVIHDVLKKRGGYWITADIYIKGKKSGFNPMLTREAKNFFKQQDTEGKKFENFDDAESFFKKMGFIIDRVADVKHSDVGSFRYMMKSLKFKDIFKLKKAGRSQATWRLKVV